MRSMTALEKRPCSNSTTESIAPALALQIERQRREAAGKADARLEERRRELVAKLELVYRELAQVEEGRPPEA